MVLSLALATLLTQTAAAESAADKAAAAAQKAAEAAMKAADAAQRIADVVAPKPAPAPAAAAPAPAADAWKGNVGLGVTYLDGNARTLTISGTLGLDKRWGDWAFGLRANGAYGLANPSATGADAVNAERALLTVRGDRSFGSGFAAIFVLVGSEFDHLKSIESRTVGEVGAGLTFFNLKEGDLEKLFLKLDIGLRGGYETDYQYYAAGLPAPQAITPYGIAILAPRAAATFRWGFSKDVRVSEELEFIPFLLAPNAGRLLINSNTKLSARVTEMINLTTGVLVQYDSLAPGGKKPTDVALTVGLEALF